MITILGAGLSGISSSFHLGHGHCVLFEEKYYHGGHIHSERLNNFTWDEGPHVSFTKHEYVKHLLNRTVSGEILENPVQITNYYKGTWIPHPAQSNLYFVPEPLKTRCLQDFLKMREQSDQFLPGNYQEWLEFALGKSFANEFSAVYTEKYWTTIPANLTTSWVGSRVFFPLKEEVVAGYESPTTKQTHYITSIRYPRQGGFFSFAHGLYAGATIQYNKKLVGISFAERTLLFDDGTKVAYTTLINTLPLPYLISISDAPADVKERAVRLSCSSVLLVNIEANHPTKRTDNWIYVYDRDKYSTRINCTELLSPANAPDKKSGIQVEVYFSKYRKPSESFEAIAKKVCEELVEMDLLESDKIQQVHTKYIPWANVIFDQEREKSLDIIFDWMTSFGLRRESDDLAPMTDWTLKDQQNDSLGHLILAGRFAQWKYFWTDDCILRGKFISDKLNPK